MVEEVRIIPGFLPPSACAEIGKLVTGTKAYADHALRGHPVPNSGWTIGAWNVPDEYADAVREIEALVAPLTPVGDRLETLRFSEMHKSHSHVAHRDNQLLDGKPNHTPQRTGAAMVYLTGCDADPGVTPQMGQCYGGQLYFPDLGIQVWPRVGQAVVFPGDVTHGVHPVLGGIRQAITIWYMKA